MARMSVKRSSGRYCITMRGRLSARDLRRLEQLCGPALEQKTTPLTLRLTRTTSTDPYAEAFLDRLVQRGAILLFD
jgi:hypothetical protein